MRSSIVLPPSSPPLSLSSHSSFLLYTLSNPSPYMYLQVNNYDLYIQRGYRFTHCYVITHASMSLTPPGVAYWRLMPVICVLCKQIEITTAPSIRVNCVTLSQVVKAVKSGKYPFVMCNFAPPDMVGHTGVYDAAVVACAATGE